MAAALFRRGGGLCCIHRELCRVVWRPQTALYSSKSTDRIQPRKTHIKKAKPQPAVDVNKLVEKLFSLTRSDIAPPAGKARRAKASSSSSSSKPPSTSSATSPTLPPPVAALSAASSLKQAHSLPRNAAFSTAQSLPQPETSSPANQKTSEPQPQTPPDVPQVSSADIQSTETLHTTSGIENVSQTIETKADVATEAFPAATVESATQTLVEPAVESSFSSVEALETEATPTGVSVESAVEVPGGDSAVPEVVVELSVETTVESPVESSFHPEEALETSAAAPSVDPKVDIKAQDVDTGKDLSLAKEELSLETTIESIVESTVPPEEALDTKGSVVEGPVDATVEIPSNDAPLDVPEVVLASKGEVIMETTLETLEPRTALVEDIVEPSIDATVNTQEMLEPLIKSQIESPEVETLVAETPVEPAVEVQARSTDPTMEAADITEVQQSTESTIELPIEANSAEEGLAAVEIAVEETVAEQYNSPDISHAMEKEKLIDTIAEGLGSEAVVSDGAVESAIKSSEANDLSDANSVQSAEESTLLPLENEMEAAEEEMKDPEKMTLDSMTLHLVQNSVESLQSDELLRTTSELDEKAAVVQIDEYGAESDSEEEGEILTEVLQKWDSLSEDLEGLEGESGMLMNELISSVPMAISKSPATSDPPGDSGASVDDPAMTLESITLAEVKEDVGSLDVQVLEETSKSLEREAEEKVKVEKMQVETKEEDAEIFADMTEPAVMTLDSISEATDAIEAETEIMMEAMFGSEQGPKQLTDAKIQEVVPQEETVAQNVEVESKDKGGGVLEAMSVESVTLAEVEAFLGTFENETLSETTDYLEKEAQVLAVDGEEKSEVVEGEKGPDVDVLSLPEVETLSEDLQTDALMEELLFTVPGPAKVVSDPKTVQEEITENVDDAAMNKDLDPVQRLFVEKIREYNKMRRLNGGLLEAEPNYQKHLSEETAKLEKLYGGGNLEDFPQFIFPEPKTDQDNK